MKKYIKAGLQVIFSVLIGGLLFNFASSVTARADNETVQLEVAYNFEFGGNITNVSESTSKISKDKLSGMTYQDAMAGDSELKRFHEESGIMFDYNNGILTLAEAMTKIHQIPDDKDMSEEEMLGGAQYFNELLPNTSVDQAATADLLTKVLVPEELSDGYRLPDLNVPLRSNQTATTIKYVFSDGSEAAPSRRVSGLLAHAAVTIKSPSVPGMTPDKGQVTVSFDQTGDHEVTVTYRKPVAVDHARLTADSSATIKVGQPVTAKTFNAQATDQAGQPLPVSVDLSQANLKKPGTYKVNLSATNGKQMTVTLIVQAASVPDKVVAKQRAIYGLKTFYLYQHPTFTKAQRLVKYPKARRTERPMFVVTGYDCSRAGRLRYQVRDVNHGSSSFGKKGYVTAKSAYVTSAYYQKQVKQIWVLSKHGINTYRQANLTGKIAHVAKGKTLKVVGLEQHNLTTRFKLANGNYITANKRLVQTVNK